jgi:hypothetical protein
MLVAAGLLACGTSGGDAVALKELQRSRAGAVEVVLLAPGDTVAKGKGSFVLEFRQADGSLVDAGLVRLNATMPMAGMSPMFASTDVQTTDMKGRYRVASDFGMAGTWRVSVDWEGPGGRGSVAFPATVQ